MASKFHFCRSSRGREMLVYDGFKYVLRNRDVDKTFWVCSAAMKEKCKAGIATTKDKNNPIQMFYKHTHPRENISLEIARIK